MTRDRVTLLALLAAGCLVAGSLGCVASAPPPGPEPSPAPNSPPPVPSVPPPPSGDCRRAHALSTRAERLADASERVHVLEQAVQLCDAEAPLWRDLGLAYRDSGDRAGARHALERARALDPSDSVTGDALDALTH